YNNTPIMTKPKAAAHVKVRVWGAVTVDRSNALYLPPSRHLGSEARSKRTGTSFCRAGANNFWCLFDGLIRPVIEPGVPSFNKFQPDPSDRCLNQKSNVCWF